MPGPYGIISGQGGNVRFGPNAVAPKEWSALWRLSVDKQVLTTPAVNVGWTTDIPVTKEWEVQIDMYWDILRGNPYLVFYVGARGDFVGRAGNTGYAASGQIRIIEVNFKNSPTQLIPVTIKASGQGPLTVAVSANDFSTATVYQPFR